MQDGRFFAHSCSLGNSDPDDSDPGRFAVAAVLLAATALLLEARSRNEVFPHRESLNSLPLQFGAWTGSAIGIEQPTLDILGAGEFLLRDYVNPSQPSQKAGDTIHSPNHCLPGAGWVPTEQKLIQIARPDGSSFSANRYVISKSGERALVLYWYLAHDRGVASEYWAKYYLVADSIRMNRSDGALVRFLTPMYKGESSEAAQARVMWLGSQVIPILNKYIPR